MFVIGALTLTVCLSGLYISLVSLFHASGTAAGLFSFGCACGCLILCLLASRLVTK